MCPARMIKLRTMTSDDATRTGATAGTPAKGVAAPGDPGAVDPGVRDAGDTGSGGAGATEARRPRPRRTLSLADLLVRVPIGFLWLGVLAIVAVPVMIYMTCLYWAVRWTSALFGKNRAPRTNRSDREERVA